MIIKEIFSENIGQFDESSVLPVARQLFADNKQKLCKTETGICTTLLSYHSDNDTAELNNKEAVNFLKTAIVNNAKLYYKELGFDVSQLNFNVKNLWLNEMEKSSFHEMHSHYGFQLSGCFYVDVPPNSGLINFHTSKTTYEPSSIPIKEYTKFNAPLFGLTVKEGDMVFWYSLMRHSVPELEFEGVRRSIAFDLKISRNRDIKQSMNTNLEDHIACYNIKNLISCEAVIESTKNSSWDKHSYNNSLVGLQTSYSDDLDILWTKNDFTHKLENIIKSFIKDYCSNYKTIKIQAITDVRFNKYEVGTNMKGHCDHIRSIFDGERKGIPILSIVGLLNDDFKGGDFLMFGDRKINLSAGDVLVFPSNFLYPHAVTTVTEGTRFSFVSWAY